MKESDSEFAEKVRQLQETFDHSFAAPLEKTKNEEMDFISFQAAGDLFALPLAELAGLERARKIVPVPGQPPRSRGVAGIRGAVVPVFSLPVVDAGSGWLALFKDKDPVAFEFGGLRGHLRVSSAGIFPPPAGAQAACARGVFKTETGSGLILDPVKILEWIANG